MPRPARLISKFNIDIADWNGVVFRRRLLSAERFSDSAIWLALRNLKTPGSRSSASLPFDTAADHRCTRVTAFGRFGAVRREGDF